MFPPVVGNATGSEGLLRLIRGSTLLSKSTPFLIQVISGGGIPVAEQVKVTGSVSFAVYVKVLCGGKVTLEMTGGERTITIKVLNHTSL